MLRLTVSVLLVLLFGSVANAEKYVVTLECVVFDRELTDEETQLMRDRIQKGQATTYGEEHLRLLRANTRKRFVQKCTLTLGPNENASQKMETDSAMMEAHIRVVEANEESCRLDIQWGFAMIVDDRSSSSARHTEVRWVPIGKERSISWSGTKGFNRQFIIHVRKATDEDMVPKKIPENFGDDIQKKIKGAGRSDKLT